ncbi:NifB/NifX family molybdenum-iron cluster-binding protein [Candidatus Micrarchaeota archaeon]|nr:NifB/NifX family molybdenum-iron cluster-binding protein [Candidatus Micrarchaeota archaeon]
MKVAVSCTGNGLEAPLSPVFGRCESFELVEVEGKKIKGSENIENTGAKQFGGAGISAAQLVGNKGVKAVITGNIGPKAFDVLSQLGIELYLGEKGTVKENVEKYLSGRLKKNEPLSGAGRGMWERGSP